MYSVPPRPNTTQEFRMVRRARTFSLEGDPEWVNESIVMRADALDNQTHTPCEPQLSDGLSPRCCLTQTGLLPPTGHPREPPMDYCEWSHA